MGRGRPKSLPSPVQSSPDDVTDVVVLSVRLKSGRFESSLSVPLYAGKEAKKSAVDQWLGLIEFALKSDVREMRATFDDGKTA